jgi:hypothetical protein
LVRRRAWQQLKRRRHANILYTQVASDLFKNEVVEFLSTPHEDPHFQISWHLPQLVLLEREYQMNSRAVELLPGLAKLERVLGHQLNITAAVVQDRIASTIQHQLETHKVNLVALEPASVDWAAIIDAAVRRKPPFQVGEKEKGFRDAVIIETFLQEVARSPKSASVCLLAMVTGDELAREALKLRTVGMGNVRILADLDDLKGLINTLGSEVSEEYIEELRKKAAPLFWTNNDDKSTLYFTGEIPQKAKKQFEKEFVTLPAGMTRLVDKTIYITEIPTFVQKVGATIHWKTKLRFQQELFRPTAAVKLASTAPSGELPSTPTAKGLLAGLLSFTSQDELAATRDLTFYVSWSTRVNTKKQLNALRLDGITHDATATSLTVSP